MSLKPLGSAVFIEIIEYEKDSALLTEFQELTAELAEGLDFSVSKRQIEAAISQKEKQQQQGLVIATGPDCRELEEGDVVIFPLYSGSMVTIVDEIENTYRRVFVLTEASCLARYREG